MVATRAFPGWSRFVLPGKVTGIQRLAGPHRGQGEAFDVSTSATTGVAGRYASALFELADNARSLDQVAEDLRTFRTMVAESAELARLLASPVIGRAAGQGAARGARRRRHQGPDPQLHRHGGRQRPRPRAARHGARPFSPSWRAAAARPRSPSRRPCRCHRPSCSSSLTRCARCWAAPRFPSMRTSNPTFSAVSSSRSARACSIRPSAASCSVCSLP